MDALGGTAYPDIGAILQIDGEQLECLIGPFCQELPLEVRGFADRMPEPLAFM